MAHAPFEMKTPAVTIGAAVPPAVMPKSFTEEEPAKPARGTAAPAGTGAPLDELTVVPAPIYSAAVPGFVTVTDEGPGGTVASGTAVPPTVTCDVTITF
jgi:hypothetical protein